MKVQIEIQEKESYEDATFSLSITDMSVKDRESLKELPDIIAQQYRNFFKLRYGIEKTDGEMHRTSNPRTLQDTL